MESETDTLDLGNIENASADLYVADVMVSAAEGFCREVRGWLKFSDSANDHAKRSLNDVETMLGELRDKIGVAKGQIDNFVDDTCTKRRARLAA